MSKGEKYDRIIAYGALLLCATFWGWSFFATTVVVKVASPIEVITVRWMIAAGIFLVLIATGKIRIDLRKPGTRQLMLTAFCQPFIFLRWKRFSALMQSYTFEAGITCIIFL